MDSLERGRTCRCQPPFPSQLPLVLRTCHKAVSDLFSWRDILPAIYLVRRPIWSPCRYDPQNHITTRPALSRWQWWVSCLPPGHLLAQPQIGVSFFPRQRRSSFPTFYIRSTRSGWTLSEKISETSLCQVKLDLYGRARKFDKCEKMVATPTFDDWFHMKIRHVQF